MHGQDPASHRGRCTPVCKADEEALGRNISVLRVRVLQELPRWPSYQESTMNVMNTRMPVCTACGKKITQARVWYEAGKPYHAETGNYTKGCPR